MAEWQEDEALVVSGDRDKPVTIEHAAVDTSDVLAKINAVLESRDEATLDSKDDLKGKELVGMDLRGVDFRGFDLEGTVFKGGDLTGANFAGMDLSNTRFENVALRECNLSGCRLKLIDNLDCSGAKMAGMQVALETESLTLTNLNFSRAELDGVDFSAIEIIKGCNFSFARLNGANFERVCIKDSIFDGASLVGANMKTTLIRENSRGYNANFQNANLTSAVIHDGEFKGGDFQGAQMRKAWLTNVSLEGSQGINKAFEGVDKLQSVSISRNIDFSGADLSGARLSGLKWSGLRMQGSFLKGCVIRGCEFKKGDFSEADLEDVCIHHSCFDGSKFMSTNMSNGLIRSSYFNRDGEACDFTDANLTGIWIKNTETQEAIFKRTNMQRINAVREEAKTAHYQRERDLEDNPWYVRGAVFEDVDLSDSDLRNLALLTTTSSRADIPKTLFSSANFRGCDLSGVSFGFAQAIKGCDFRDTTLLKTNFTAARLEACDLSELDLSEKTLRALAKARGMEGKDFYPEIGGVDFIRCNLRGANLSDYTLNGSFVGTDFTRANLTKTTFTPEADVTEADFSYANLSGASFRPKGIMEVVSFYGAERGSIFSRVVLPPGVRWEYLPQPYRETAGRGHLTIVGGGGPQGALSVSDSTGESSDKPNTGKGEN